MTISRSFGQIIVFKLSADPAPPGRQIRIMYLVPGGSWPTPFQLTLPQAVFPRPRSLLVRP